jgi:4-aminobutyrate aminotransferase-like enzyme
MASAIAVINYIKTRNLVDRAEKIGEKIFNEFRNIQSKVIGDIRGKGFMIGIEIVKDKSMKTPGKELAERLREELAKNGVLMHTCGHYDNVMRFMPSLTIPEKLLSIVVEKFEKSIKEVERSI